ncbi:MAG: hypothetical protein KKB51_09135 [Candidatus Riflebacteria bacterium]|nr:hypothetical protein [Candidatus Riflebacteria bacterium]
MRKLKSISNIIYSFKRFVLTVFGDVKVFKWPMFIVYHPTTFKIKGWHTREIMTAINPGDVVMRAYDDYLDGYFIPKGESRCSHSGLYVGDNKIVHSIAEGSTLDDIIDFCRADRIVVLRPNNGQAWAIEHAKKCADANVEYDFNFEPGPGRYYCHEFTASCYPHLNIEPLSRNIFRIIPSPKAFLADSFYTNKNFTKIYSSDD